MNAQVLDRFEWVQQSGNPVSYASLIRKAPLPGSAPKPVIVQFAKGDGTVPNPSSSVLWTRSEGFQRVPPQPKPVPSMDSEELLSSQFPNHDPLRQPKEETCGVTLQSIKLLRNKPSTTKGGDNHSSQPKLNLNKIKGGGSPNNQLSLSRIKGGVSRRSKPDLLLPNRLEICGATSSRIKDLATLINHNSGPRSHNRPSHKCSKISPAAQIDLQAMITAPTLPPIVIGERSG